jgi:hypothetical protein
MRKTLTASKQFMDVAYRTQSWQPVDRNGWLIKFCIFNGDHIMLIFTSTYTTQTIIREFSDENNACEYINFVIELDPMENHLL